jgi:hypothetical protein
VSEFGEARGPVQFPELGLLLLGDAQGFVICDTSLDGLGMPLSSIDLSSTTTRSQAGGSSSLRWKFPCLGGFEEALAIASIKIPKYQYVEVDFACWTRCGKRRVGEIGLGIQW